MSGRPNTESVERLLSLVLRHARLRNELAVLNSTITEAQTRQEAAREEFGEAGREIIKLLGAMDCSSNGNTGWENRILWMLEEFGKQATEAGAAGHY